MSLVTVYGTVAADGSRMSGTGYSCEKDALRKGVYKIALHLDLERPPVVVVTGVAPTREGREEKYDPQDNIFVVAGLDTPPANAFLVRSYDLIDDQAEKCRARSALQDKAFSFIAMAEVPMKRPA